MTSYERGRRFEYEVRDFLRSLGFLVVRCAGSKPFDLVAVHPSKPCPPLFIECRAGRSGRPVRGLGFAPVILVARREGWRERLVAELRELGFPVVRRGGSPPQ